MARRGVPGIVGRPAFPWIASLALAMTAKFPLFINVKKNIFIYFEIFSLR
jgi:hypothetical protein